MKLKSTLHLHFFAAAIICFLLCWYAASISLVVSFLGVGVAYFISELLVRFLKKKALLDDDTYVKCISQITIRAGFILLLPLFHIANHYLEKAAVHAGHHMTVGALSKIILVVHLVLITIDLCVSIARDVMCIRERGGLSG
ncbi:hypothetical protein QTV49_000539 [Vibrio vulnificus]|nr:hypothetical protein [Vibrio vulnificus]